MTTPAPKEKPVFGGVAAPTPVPSGLALDIPPVGIEAVTPSNSVDLTQVCRGFMVGTAGDVACVFADGTTGTLPGCVVGTQYGAVITRVKATGTTATGIVGLH